ncbi:MAG: trigger factor [Bdellovibrionales bacterium]|nr:trigger factor [Bdellovibrionales bacterium]
MKTSLEKTSGLGRKLIIQVPADKVSSTFDRVYKGIQKNANIKGFRKGKAPLNTIKSIYSDRVKQDVLEDLISEAYQSALTEHALRPVSQPNVNFDKLEEADEFQFTAEFEVRPEVTLKKTEKLKVEKEQLDISDEKIDSILLQIRESRAALVPVFEERPAKSGDIADIDFAGTIDGKPLEGGSMNGHKLHLGSNSFIPGFEEGVVGMTIGAKKELNLTFPADYGHADIAGKAVKFDIKLNGLLKKDLPALNDEFVKSLGGYNTVDELKKVIRQDITEQETKRIYDDLKGRILKALVEANPVEVPEILKKQQKQFLIEDTEKRMKEQGMSEADYTTYKEKWAKDFEETAEFMIQSSFLIETIAEKNKLGATQAEFEDKLAQYAKSSGIEIEKLREFYSNNHDRKHQLKYQVTEEKVVNYLIDNAEVKEVPSSKLNKK